MGDFCEKKIPFCTEQYNPCKNNAPCVDHDTYYTCECLPGFKGENCTINIDDCENHMCQVTCNTKLNMKILASVALITIFDKNIHNKNQYLTFLVSFQ